MILKSGSPSPVIAKAIAPGPRIRRVVLMSMGRQKRAEAATADRHQEGVGRYIKALRHLDAYQGATMVVAGVVQHVRQGHRGPASTRSAPTHAGASLGSIYQTAPAISSRFPQSFSAAPGDHRPQQDDDWPFNIGV